MGENPQNTIPFKTLIPISEIIATAYKTQPFTKKVQNEYNNLIKNFDTEFNILLEVPESDLTKVTNQKIANIIILNRQGKLKVQPGYDGVYGKILMPNEGIEETKLKSPEQKSISDF